MSDRSTEGFESKLLKYSLTAGAILLGAREARATIDVTNPGSKGVLTGKESLGISFGGSGTNFVITVQSSNHKGQIVGTGNDAWVAPSGTGVPPPKALSTNYVIGTGVHFASPGASTSATFVKNTTVVS